MTLALFSLDVPQGIAQEGELAASAEESKDPSFVVITKVHWNWDNMDGNPKRWLELQTAWHENVVMKNNKIKGAGTFYHLFSEDNSEVLLMTGYENWNDIVAARAVSAELAKAAWPDDDERAAMNKERFSYYSPEHSDEIYATLPYAKPVTEFGKDSYVYYVMKQKRDYPEDGTTEEFAELTKEFHTKVTNNNPHLKGYYTHQHAWGADAREISIVYVVESICDIDAMLDAQGELSEKAWPEEEDRKAFFKKLNRYYTPQHSDMIYTNEPKLMK